MGEVVGWWGSAKAGRAATEQAAFIPGSWGVRGNLSINRGRPTVHGKVSNFHPSCVERVSVCDGGRRAPVCGMIIRGAERWRKRYVRVCLHADREFVFFIHFFPFYYCLRKPLFDGSSRTSCLRQHGAGERKSLR